MRTYPPQGMLKEPYSLIRELSSLSSSFTVDENKGLIVGTGMLSGQP